MPVKRTNPDYQAQAILSRRDHSVFEIKTKMKRKGFTVSQVSSTIAKLKKLKLLDDHAFTNKYIDETLHSKNVGPRWVIHKLRQKGIDQATINEAVTAAFAEGNEAKLAKQAAAQWRQLHPSTGSGQALKERQRLTHFLISRGFSAVAGECALQSTDESQTNY